MASVVLENVVKRYKSVTAVDDLSITVEDREFAVLVGPSGCGKSTALRMIAGLEDITGGSIYIGGRKVNDVAPKDRDIAMVFQNYALYPHMNVRENLGFGLRMRGFPRAEIDQRVADAADILGIQELLDRKPKQLSGGQRQRVAVGRAIVRKPAVFLFDEPLSNLDAKLRVATRAEISKLHRRLGATIIYVTHDQVEAMTMANRIFIMDRGKLQQSGPPMELYQQPANRFVAGFIGSPAMNFVPARLTREGDDVLVDATGFKLALPRDLGARSEPYVGRPVVFGIRPEHVSARPPGTAGAPGASFGARADVVETLGAEAFVYFTCGPHAIVARMDAPERPLTVGEAVELELDMSKAHLFDSETSRAII